MANGSRESRSAAASPHARWWLWGALTLAFLRVLPALRFPIGRDEATYAVIGQGLLHGQHLYRDLWDNKPPGIFYIYAVIVKIFGPVMWSIGIVDILWMLAISICIFYFARRYLGLRPPPLPPSLMPCGTARGVTSTPRSRRLS